MLSLIFYPEIYREREAAVDKRLRINHQIRVPEVRLIDSDGSQLGLKTIADAIGLAQERGLDLVEIAPMAKPPVCKIIDFTKLRYEQEKKAKEARKKQKGGHLKEIRIRPSIGEHDFGVKIKHICDFLKAQDKVRVSVMFKGRENKHKELGHAIAERIRATITEMGVGEVEGRVVSMGNRLFLNLTPTKIAKK